jgi:hypothetical protein
VPGDTDSKRAKDRAPGRGSSAKGARAIRQLQGGHRSTIPLVIGTVVVVVAVAGVVTIVAGHHPRPTEIGPAQIDTNAALLASAAGQAGGEPVDGIEAGSMEQLVFHIHAHLAIYVNGQQKLVPYGIGIVPPYRLQKSDSGPFVGGGSKFYWLHTHDETGIIHIESPQQRTFTLGNLFDIWHQPLGPTQVGPATGPVVALVNNHPVSGDPRAIPLGAHDVVQLNIGTPEPFHAYTFPNGL